MTVLVILLLLIAAFVGGILFYRKNKTQVDNTVVAVGDATEELVDAAKDSIEDVKDKLK